MTKFISLWFFCSFHNPVCSNIVPVLSFLSTWYILETVFNTWFHVFIQVKFGLPVVWAESLDGLTVPFCAGAGCVHTHPLGPVWVLVLTAYKYLLCWGGRRCLYIYKRVNVLAFIKTEKEKKKKNCLLQRIHISNMVHNVTICIAHSKLGLNVDSYDTYLLLLEQVTVNHATILPSFQRRDMQDFCLLSRTKQWKVYFKRHCFVCSPEAGCGWLGLLLGWILKLWWL